MNQFTEFYLDLDGLGTNWQEYVLANHFPHMSNISELNKHKKRKQLMRKMYEKDPSLFYNLPPIEGYRKLIATAKTYGDKWFILTAAGTEHPSPKQATRDKIHYLAEIFEIPPERVIVTRTSNDKLKYAKPGAVLVDDFDETCERWEAAGGTAIHVLTNDYDPDSVAEQMKNAA